MFSTIKSRIVAIYIIVIFISIISSLLIGAQISKIYVSNQIYGDMDVLYRIESGDELDSIANTDYFSQDRILVRANNNLNVQSQINQSLITEILIVSLILIIVFALIFNLGYNYFIRDAIAFNSEKIQDFTSVKQMVSIQNDKITNSYRDVDKINSYINHELKNSLAILKTKQLNSSEFEDYIEELNKQIDDIGALTTNTLANSNEVDLLIVIAGIIDNYRNNQIEFDFEDGDFKMTGNASLLSRAVDNIINNAFKYGANQVDINAYNLHDSIVIKVANDGPMIDMLELDKIFEFKYRTPELKRDGSGIGLALVKNIVELHNGGIYVESNPEQTTFYLSFKCS